METAHLGGDSDTMTITLNINDDYLIFDNKETIVFQNQGGTPVTINNVVRRPVVLVADDGGGSTVYGSSVEFLIYKREVNFPFNPKLNAKITDQNGKSYRVDVIDDGAWRTRWAIRATSDAAQGVN